MDGVVDWCLAKCTFITGLLLVAPVRALSVMFQGEAGAQGGGLVTPEAVTSALIGAGLLLAGVVYRRRRNGPSS
jgi:hypothetical protein